MKRKLALICSTLILLLFGQALHAEDLLKNRKLVIVGGGKAPVSILKKFVELAGKEPKLVVIPTASENIDEARLKKRWNDLGVKHITILHTRNREVASQEDFVKPLKDATGVWFGGGKQSRIAAAYVGTLVEKEIYQLLKRGGVVGGSSAGAAIQTKVMIAGSEGSKPKISTGLDLLPKSIVDQHFLARNRLARLSNAVKKHPELIGYGIDESTALVLNEGKLSVLGSSYVLQYKLTEGELHINAFSDGQAISLQK